MYWYNPKTRKMEEVAVPETENSSETWRSRTAMKTWSMPITSTGTGPLLSETLAAGYDNAISPLQNRGF